MELDSVLTALMVRLVEYPKVETVNITIPICALCFWLMAGFCCVSARAQSQVFRSFTHQFTARELKGPPTFSTPAKSVLKPIVGRGIFLFPSPPNRAAANADELVLDPALLVAQCERIKSTMLAELGEVDNWRGRIDLIINPALAPDSDPQLTVVRRNPGWSYELLLPKRVTHEDFSRRLFQTLLLEMANRQTDTQSTEIPLWLVEGMSAHLQANSLETFMLQPGQSVSASVVWNRGAQIMPVELRQHPALAFQELSWPDESNVSEQGLPLYRSCAQLFLEGLLKFNDGKTCLRSMIDQLAEHWNWQTAFLKAFHSHFDQLLDAEKWWSVNYIDSVRGYKAQAWSADDSRRSLQSSLDVPIKVRFDTNHMPVDAKVTLQEVIQKWSHMDALNALQRTIGELRFLEPRATGEWRALSDLYLKTLLEYLKDSGAAQPYQMMGKHDLPYLPEAKEEAIKKLNALDRQRDALWPSTISSNPQLRASQDLSPKTVAVH
jgi:hypothetical protein